MLLSVSLHVCHYSILRKKVYFFITSAVLVQLLFPSREQCGGMRCNRDWARRWGRWEEELKGVMDERERWEETRRPLGVVRSSSSDRRDVEYCTVIDALVKSMSLQGTGPTLDLQMVVHLSIILFSAAYFLNSTLKVQSWQVSEDPVRMTETCHWCFKHV